MRNLVLVLGDQLDRRSTAFAQFDQRDDSVWMAEVDQEATHVWCHKQRIAYFFSAMRHFRDELRQRDVSVHYHQLTANPADDRGANFAEILEDDVKRLAPDKLIAAWPGDYRVKHALEQAAERLDVPLEIRPDDHFYCSPDEFAEYADGRKTLVLETFYRHMRKQHDVLIDNDNPVGGSWNFDEDNRASFDREGPGDISQPHAFRTDKITDDVLKLVDVRYGDHPGSLDDFCLPVTREQALAMLRDFVDRQLPLFGKYEDAMWTDEAFLYHSRLSAPLNLKLLNPRDCVEKAVAAYASGDAPINSVEGFVRQILGWREFIRGVYWLHMPDYADKNQLRHQADVPSFFWDGKTDMKCVENSMSHVLRYGYAHHIQRLMVLGNLALLLGVHPYRFHEWHMAMYVDAVDWVSLPNALGMSQFGDGGIVGTKPYVSTGNYINRMSNYCQGCKYDYRKSTGDDACPFSTLYWDFLDRHGKQFAQNHRMGMQMKNLERKKEQGELDAIRAAARRLKRQWRD